MGLFADEGARRGRGCATEIHFAVLGLGHNQLQWFNATLRVYEVDISRLIAQWIETSYAYLFYWG